MEDQCSPLTWGFCYQDEGMDELRHTLLYTTLELETTLISAKEEVARREFELIHLKDVLSRTIKERDEAQTRCQKLMLEKLMLQQQLEMTQQQKVMQEHHQETAAISGISSGSQDETKPVDSNKQISSFDCNKGILPSPQLKSEAPLLEEAFKLAANRPLPEKGKLLQAVKEAGPLLQTLLLAGPLPQWQHPPPQLHSIEIPPVAPMAISSPTSLPRIHQDSFHVLNACISKKRDLELCDSYDSSPNTKYQKAAFN